MKIMRLFIAEKPSVARAIADELGVTEKGDGYIQCGNDVVTHCFGHMLEQAEPDEYTAADAPVGKSGKKIWRTEDLPIIPEQWILRPKDDAKKQLAVIKKLIGKASQIVNAGDPDREGQLLVDEVLDHFGNSKPVTRFWVSAQDSVSIQRGLKSLTPNEKYAGWANAAKARQRADWLIGMNLTRAYTLRAGRGGAKALLTVGRVQTPTLSLVVARDREIEKFKSIPYHTLKAKFQHANGTFDAKWAAKDDQSGLDSEGRLIDTAIANGLVEKLANAKGVIAEYKQEAKKKPHPLAFSLSDITAIASAKFGYSADQVLKVCQALYETHKLTTYPRTDSAYLPTVQFADAKNVLEAVAYVNPELTGLIENADVSIRSRTWDDTKTTAHHGIIPTMKKGNKSALSEPEKNIYQIIVLAYVSQFYPLHEYLQTSVVINAENEEFKASGKVITKNGWMDVYNDEEEKASEENAVLPAMNKDDMTNIVSVERVDSKTKPPARFTEGTLLKAMENIHKFVSDPEHKRFLKDGDGIGTSATRASIISELKKREYLEVKGKNIVSSQLGRSILDALPEVVKNPVLTAIYERMLAGIEAGTSTIEDFIQKQEFFIREQVEKANDGAVKIAGVKDDKPVSVIHKCMSCGGGLIRRPSKKAGVFWWGCSNYPECKQTYFDKKGKPDYSSGAK